MKLSYEIRLLNKNGSCQFGSLLRIYCNIILNRKSILPDLPYDNNTAWCSTKRDQIYHTIAYNMFCIELLVSFIHFNSILSYINIFVRIVRPVARRRRRDPGCECVNCCLSRWQHKRLSNMPCDHARRKCDYVNPVLGTY